MRAFTTLLPLLAVGSLLAAGCASPPNNANTQGKLQVVAAESFWQNLAQQLGGDRVQVTSLIQNPDADPHDYEPTTADARTVATAQLVIVNGLGYDRWLSKLLAANQPSQEAVLTVGDLANAGPEANPHQWYSPASVQKVIDQTTATYKHLRPQDASYFDSQKANLESEGLGQYKQLIADIQAKYAGTPVGASESIFEPLASDLGLRLITPPGYLKATSEGTEPTAQDKQDVDHQLSTRQVRVWIDNEQNATPDTQRMTETARKAHIPVVTMTETPPEGASFQDWQTAQLSQLSAALNHGASP